jgi:flagellar motor switch protein FliG
MRDQSYRKHKTPKNGASTESTEKETATDAGEAVRGFLKTGKGGSEPAPAPRESSGAAPGATSGPAPGSPPTGFPTDAAAAGAGAAKAAKFLMVVGRDEAAEILRHLDEADVEAVTREIARIGTLSKSDADALLREVGAAVETVGERHGGPAVAKEFLNRAFGDEKAEEVYTRLRIGESERFAFLEELEPQQVALLLKEESSPVVSTILATLSAETAARVVQLLPQEVRGEVVLRMARMNAVAPEVLERVEEVLKERIRQQGKIVSDQIDGRGTLASILRYMDLDGERAVLDSLAEEDPELAKSIRDRLFTIDSILAIDDRDLQPVLAEFGEREIACVLIGQSERVRTKILRNVSERRARDVSEEYVHQGDIPDPEVSNVQQRFLDYLRKLAEEGTILARHPEDEYI